MAGCCEVALHKEQSWPPACAPAGVATLTVRELFDFAVDPVLTEEGLDAALDALMDIASRYGGAGTQLSNVGQPLKPCNH